MQVELVNVTTQDGLSLAGVVAPPQGPASVPIDACIMVHGRGGSFYRDGVLGDFRGRLVALGCTVFTINTRGAGGEVVMARTTQGRVRIGAACEVVAECRYDLEAWIGEAAGRGFRRVALWGHSLGALKSILYQAETMDERISCVIAGSPPWLSYAHFNIQPEGEGIVETCERASTLVASGKGHEIFEVTAPLAGTLSTASQYLEKYGPDENYDLFRFLPGISCPILVTTGTKEAKTMVAFRGLHDRLEAMAGEQDNLSAALIEDADHSYTGVRDVAFSVVKDWLEAMPTARAEA